jgi:hypothetical protein
MLDGVEGNRERQIGESGVDAILLVDGHLEFLERVIRDALLEDTDEKIVGELILLGESGCGDGLEAGEEVLIGLVALADGGKREVGELVVIAVVAEGGGALGEVAEVGFVLLLEEGVLSREALGDGLGVLGEDRGDECDEQADAVREAHRYLGG